MVVLLLLSCLQMGVQSRPLSKWSAASSSFGICENLYPNKLDVAIYFAAIVPDTGGHGVSFEKSCPLLGQTSENFDPGKKTLIFLHGLQPDFVLLEEDRFGVSSEIQPFIAAWLAAGWNVGVFQWTQFADEHVEHFQRAEGKIWSTSYLANMEYTFRDSKHKVRVGDGPSDETVTDMFVREYLSHFTVDGYWPNEIRVVGHSLGTQLALVSLNQLIDMNELDMRVRVPDRVGLLDPVMSPGDKPYLANQYGATGSDLSRFLFGSSSSIMTYLSAMAHRATLFGVAIEYYKTSFITRCIFTSHEDNTLVEWTAFAVVIFPQFGNHPIGQCLDLKQVFDRPKDTQQYVSDTAYQVMHQHIAIVPYYFMSYFAPPLQCLLQSNPFDKDKHDGCVPEPGKYALSAGMATADILKYSSPLSNQDGDKLCFHEFIANPHALPRFPGKANIDYSQVFDTANDLFFLQSCRHVNT
jgi:hypothetical protein